MIIPVWFKEIINPLISRNIFIAFTFTLMSFFAVYEFLFMEGTFTYINYLQKLSICIFFLGLFMGIWRFLTINTWTIQITSQRVMEEKGVLSRVTNELELFRVKDIKLDQPLFLNARNKSFLPQQTHSFFSLKLLIIKSLTSIGFFHCIPITN